jgi:toxin YoeB
MGKVNFTDEGWSDYLYWQSQDKKTLRRINQLIADAARNQHSGLGKPEALKYELAGFWSRRIDDKNRMIYRVLEDGSVEIAALRTHYNAK